MINFKKLLRSFKCAFRGIGYLIKGQNFVIEIFFGVTVIIFSILLNISHFEFIAVLMMVFLVLILEIINTIFERIIDILHPRLHPFARVIKDMMAGGVLIACLGAVIIGIVIFYSYIL